MQEGYPFAMTDDPDMPLLIEFPARAPDQAVYGGMMPNFNDIFTLHSQTSLSTVESGLASMTSSGARQFHSITDSTIGMATNLPTTDSPDLMYSTPESTV